MPGLARRCTGGVDDAGLEGPRPMQHVSAVRRRHDFFSEAAAAAAAEAKGEDSPGLLPPPAARRPRGEPGMPAEEVGAAAPLPPRPPDLRPLRLMELAASGVVVAGGAPEEGEWAWEGLWVNCWRPERSDWCSRAARAAGMGASSSTGAAGELVALLVPVAGLRGGRVAVTAPPLVAATVVVAGGVASGWQEEQG